MRVTPIFHLDKHECRVFMPAISLHAVAVLNAFRPDGENCEDRETRAEALRVVFGHPPNADVRVITEEQMRDVTKFAYHVMQSADAALDAFGESMIPDVELVELCENRNGAVRWLTWADKSRLRQAVRESLEKLRTDAQKAAGIGTYILNTFTYPVPVRLEG